MPSAEISTDIKVTSIKQPQSSCPFKDAKQKIFGLGYNLLVFVYDKADDPTTKTAILNFVSCSFISKERTADYTTTFRLIEMVKDKANEADIITYLNDKNIPADEITLSKLAKQILKKLKGQTVVLPRLFRKGIYSQHTNLLKFVRRNLGIQKAMPEWEDLFNGMKQFSFYLLQLEIDEGYINTAQIDFKNKKNKLSFFKKLSMISNEGKPYQEKSLDGKFLAIKDLSPTEVIYLESSLSAKKLKLYLQDIK